MLIVTPRSDRIPLWRDRIFSICPLNVVKNVLGTISFIGKNIAFR